MNIDQPLLSQEKVSRRKKAIKSFKARANAKRTSIEKFADWLTSFFGTVPFLIVNIIWFVIWIILNTNMIEGVIPFDPYPFGFLTMIVSLEAIILAIVVLISQNREARVAELREEVELYINTYAESEITKIIELQCLILEKSGIDVSHDKELQIMRKNLESNQIEKELIKQLERN